jgi:hypothetical protein
MAVLVVTLGLLAQAGGAYSQNQSSIQVGAWGDDASRGNMGVRVEIQTHTYDGYPGVLDYFWVGDNLADGAFFQFGYAIQPGYYCLKGEQINGKFSCLSTSEQIMDSDVRWLWQYWPNQYRKDFYYEIGPAGSAGVNSTWHLYSITPNSTNGWAFEIDDRVVAHADSPLASSTDPAFIVAEKTSPSELRGQLGPVEFRNLAYLRSDGWHPASSFVALVNCGDGSTCLESTIGVAAPAPNHIIVGSGVSKHADGELLWTIGFVNLDVIVHPETQFYVTTLSHTQLFTGNASVRVPEGMFAYVSLLAPATRAKGFLGTLGASDEFKGWIGDIRSQNMSVRLFMNRDVVIEATWSTSFDIPLLLAAGLLGIIASVMIYFSRRRRGQTCLSNY